MLYSGPWHIDILYAMTTNKIDSCGWIIWCSTGDCTKTDPSKSWDMHAIERCPSLEVVDAMCAWRVQLCVWLKLMLLSGMCLDHIGLIGGSSKLQVRLFHSLQAKSWRTLPRLSQTKALVAWPF